MIFEISAALRVLSWFPHVRWGTRLWKWLVRGRKTEWTMAESLRLWWLMYIYVYHTVAMIDYISSSNIYCVIFFSPAQGVVEAPKLYPIKHSNTSDWIPRSFRLRQAQWLILWTDRYIDAVKSATLLNCCWKQDATQFSLVQYTYIDNGTSYPWHRRWAGPPCPEARRIADYTNLHPDPWTQPLSPTVRRLLEWNRGWTLMYIQRCKHHTRPG